ncbi:glycosyltransferase [Streptococcus loxodontisalivarius]|uniref:Glycosyltransferase 2-like domain-containing protein n=1 Tax=Streptococcus loxodontisalivarius TaxID=1349415 RepID=A0ABS2PP19_9STRE|nr:glycosyltransferase [Streptococcus loxodontisalivarius]MBM7641773.1 hypothetical protein [Streptococcus loxodontisalivarius]
MQIYYTAVVVYNSLLSDSETLSNLSKINNHNIKVIIYDNSDNKEYYSQNELLANTNNWKYLSNHENVGLSRAYNKILDSISDSKGIVVWLDDDTNITQEYFDALDSSISENIDIYTPVIKAQNGKFYSPNEEGFFKNKQLKSPSGNINQNKFNAINSCTAVKLSIYSNYRYDENLFLDQIDHDFFRSQRLLGRSFLKLPVIIHHNLSLKDTSGNIESVKKRFKILIPDYKTYVAKKGRTAVVFSKIKIVAWGVQQSIKNRNVGFTFWVIKNFL